jgi:hypothetical protein
MNKPEALASHEDNWVTGLGAFLPEQGKVVFRGKDLHGELGGLPWMGLIYYGVTGRLPEARQIRLFEGIATLCTSYPDPRLWNNRIAALAGTSRSTAALGIGAAIAATEASIYGYRPIIRSIDFLYRTQNGLEQGGDLENLLIVEQRKHRTIPGYGRPLRSQDERIGPILDLASSLGFADGKYLRLAFRIEEILLRGPLRLRMNIAILLAALAAEQGLSCREYYLLRILSYCGGMIPCYLDAATQPEGTFFPLRCGRIDYAGSPPRAWNPPPA